jgi:hypothetical protein
LPLDFQLPLFLADGVRRWFCVGEMISDYAVAFRKQGSNIQKHPFYFHILVDELVSLAIPKT